MEHVVSEDFYHDDPIEEVSKTKVRSKVLSTAALIVGSIFFFQSTLAGNISLNSGRGIEFGQSVSQAVACSGDTNLTLTPRSTFINGSPGAHYLQSVTVSNIPTSCYGVDFTIRAYNDSSSAQLALFNSTSTNAVVHNNNGTFQKGIGSTGLTVSSGSGTFTITFTDPVAQSSSIFKLTIQSGAHTPYYYVGSVGPGGGFVYYVNDAGFNCGPTVSAPVHMAATAEMAVPKSTARREPARNAFTGTPPEAPAVWGANPAHHHGRVWIRVHRSGPKQLRPLRCLRRTVHRCGLQVKNGARFYGPGVLWT